MPSLRRRFLSLALGPLILIGGAQGAQAENLQEALMSAYAGNPRLLAERARVRETDENYVQARAQGRLTSDLSASRGIQRVELTQQSFLGTGPGTKVVETLKPQSAQIQVIQPIYQGGRVSALKRQAKAGILAAREGLRNAEQSIFLTAANAYEDVIRDEETARIRRNNVSVLARQELASQERFNVGEGTRTDIAQAQSRLAAAEIGLAQADAQLETSRAAYIRTVGHPPVDLQPVPRFILPQTLPEAMKIGRTNNPQLIAAIFNEEAGDAAIDVAKAAYKPTISLNSFYQVSESQSTNVLETDTVSLAAQLTIPIFTGGLNSSLVRQAKHAKTRLSFETRDTERALDQNVAQLWAQLESAKRSVIASQQQVEAAEIAFEGVELEQQVGTRTTLDVLDAEQELLNAKLAVVEAERNEDSATFQLLALLGAFDAVGLSLPVDLYDPRDNFNSARYGGREKIIDNFVPEAVQKIAPQIPEIPKDLARFAVKSLEVTKVPEVVGKIGHQVDDIPADAGVLVKETVDKITFQHPDYESDED